jgi:PAS domain S-box-containing protein
MPGAYAYTPAIWPPLVAAVFLAAIGHYAWSRRAVPGGKPFLAMSVLSILLLLAIACEAAAVAPAAKIAWYKLQFLLLFAGVVAVTCLVLDYAYPGRWLTRRNLVLLSIPFLLGLFMVVIDDGRLVWRQVEVGTDGSVLAYYAPAGAILAAYGIGMFVLNAAVFLHLFIRSPQHRWPVALMLLGQIGSRTAFLLDTAHLPASSRFDLSVFIVLLPWTMYAIVLFGFRILDPLPAARRAVIEQMHAGVVVFDAAWRVASLNPAAKRILSLPGSIARGKTWEQVIPPGGPQGTAARAEASTGPAGGETELPEMSFGTGVGARHYAPALCALHDFRGLLTGYLLMLHDVTEERRAQAQVLEQQRSLAMLKERELLARELHDGIGQVLGYAGFQVEAAGQLIDGGQAPAARAQLDRLAGVLQEAHADLRQQILDLRATPAPQQPFPAAVRHYLEGFASNYDIQAELVPAGGAGADALPAEAKVQLLRILQEALSNARRHSGARRVQVMLEAAGDIIQMSIEDDGCGFDPDEAIAPSGGHFGLDFMRQRAAELGGRLRVESEVGAGTRVVVEVPCQER